LKPKRKKIVLMLKRTLSSTFYRNFYLWSSYF